MDEQLEIKTAVSSNIDVKIEFKKSSKIRKQIRDMEDGELKDAEVDKPRLKGSKVIMPEYVVGHQRKSKKKVKGTSESMIRAAGTLKLAHILEDGEDAEEDQG
ncbi:unnamed protein product [Ceratitis capitata]|nr:unnamed protein product [Ceratitis capitata]